MTNLKPEISVIIPLFDREDLIQETLESLLAQSFQNWECIIVDDHSNDNGFSIVKKYSEMDSRIRCYLRPGKSKKGANSCRNFGLEKARGEFIYWLDSDDITHPNLLEYSIRLLKNSDFDYVWFRRKLFFGNFNRGLLEFKNLKSGKELIFSPGLIEAMLLNELEFNTCNVVWRKTSLKKERFCEDIVYADEWEYYSRLLALGLKGINLENFLIFGRKHLNSTTAEFREENPVRVASKIKATKLVISNLHTRDLYTSRLKEFFIRLGFQLRSKEIIDLSLSNVTSGHFEKFKYKLGFYLYPILRPLFIMKGKLKRT